MDRCEKPCIFCSMKQNSLAQTMIFKLFTYKMIHTMLHFPAVEKKKKTWGKDGLVEKVSEQIRKIQILHLALVTLWLYHL